MYSLAIIDDEKLIREGLISYIDWKSVGVEISGVFGSAKEALEALRGRMPDIILSDIKMPAMNGVEFLRELRSADSRSEVIFISAYRNFDYAKEAIRYGAFDFLLKPIREDLLYETVRRCVAKIRDEKAGADAEEGLFGRAAGQDPALELGRYLNGVASGRHEWREVALGLGLEPEADMVLLAASLEGGEARQRLASPSIEAALEPFRQARTLAVDGGDEVAFLCIAGIPAGAGAAAAEAVSHWARENLQGAPYGCSGVASGAEAQRLQAEALWGLIGAGINATRCPGSFAAAQRYALSLADVPVAPSGIIGLLTADDRPALAALAGSIFLGFLRRGIGFDLELMKMHVFRVLDSWLEALAVYPYFSVDLGRLREGADELAKCSDVYSLYRGAAGFLEDLRSFVQEKYADNVSRLVNMVVNYVRDNLEVDLSLQRVAEECQVSPTYLSRVFSREMGESYSHFRGRARVDRAKDLLKDPQMRINEIARLVGIDNVTHFTKLFCSFAGLPPTEYRKTLR
jgi:two-component system, response regulator YesN